MSRKEPSYGQKLNAIKFYLENPCFDPWVGIFELAAIPLGKAAFELVEPSLADIVRGYARPKNLRIGGHARRRKGKHGKGWFPEDTSEIIAKRIPGKKALAGRLVTDGVKGFWLFDGLVQEAFFYWLIVDIVLGFFYNWTSAIMQSQYCSHKGAGAALYIGGLSETLQDSWKGLTPGTVVYRTGSSIMTDRGGGASLYDNFTYSACATTRPDPANPATYNARMVLVHSDGSIVATSAYKTPAGPGEKNGHIIIWQSAAFHSLTPYIETTEGSGGMLIDDCAAMVSVAGN